MRDGICAAALELFKRGGANAVVMRNIAKVLRMSAMMPYRYFASKDHILMELRTRAFDQLTSQMHQARRQGRDPKAALRKVCDIWLRFAADEPHGYRLMFDVWAFDSPAAIKADFGEAARRHLGCWLALEDAVSDYLTALNLRKDATTAAHVAWSTLHGVASLYLARKLVFTRSYEQLVRPTVDAVLAGVAA
jgi:AcrR family transcriptional regulator